MQADAIVASDALTERDIASVVTASTTAIAEVASAGNVQSATLQIRIAYVEAARATESFGRGKVETAVEDAPSTQLAGVADQVGAAQRCRQHCGAVVCRRRGEDRDSAASHRGIVNLIGERLMGYCWGYFI